MKLSTACLLVCITSILTLANTLYGGIFEESGSVRVGLRNPEVALPFLIHALLMYLLYLAFSVFFFGLYRKQKDRSDHN